MKKLLVTVLVAFISFAVYARQGADSSYSLILNFYSIGAGVPDDQPLRDYITTYRKSNKLPALNATVAGGLGREGEYAILFPLKELTVSQRKKFVTALSQALPAINKKSGNGGGINLSQNQPFEATKGRVKPATVRF